MGRHDPEDDVLRGRVRAWVTHYWKIYEARGYNQNDFAAALGITGGYLSDIKSGHRTAGLKALAGLLKLDVRGVDLHQVLTKDPPEELPATEDVVRENPTKASPSTVHRGRRAGGDGRH